MLSRKIPFTLAQARLLAVLALINFVNFADRAVLNPLLPLLRQHFGVSDTWLGSLPFFLLVILALASIPSGYLADRFNEPKIIAGGVLFWSLAAIASGFAPTFFILFVVRGFVGIGEAAYAPAAQSLISDSFSKGNRALAQAVFASGMILGAVSGLALGGIMGARHGWQHAFIIIGVLGILPGLSALIAQATSAAAPLGSCQPLGASSRARFRGHDRRGHLYHFFQRFLSYLGH